MENEAGINGCYEPRMAKDGCCHQKPGERLEQDSPSALLERMDNADCASRTVKQYVVLFGQGNPRDLTKVLLF